MSYVVELSDLSAADVLIAGGKAANLGELRKISGIKVPDGYCILSSCFSRVLGEEIEYFEKMFREYDDLSEVSAKIESCIINVNLPYDVKKDIFMAYANLNSIVAVRSSASGEDSSDHAYAGLADTKLNVNYDNLFDAVKQCWASLYSERSLVYRREFEQPLGVMAVVMQNMVHPKTSGVMFTADHIHKRKDTIIIEANWGYGDCQVSGYVSPDIYKIDKQTGKVRKRKINQKRFMSVSDFKEGTKIVEAPDEKREKECLDEDQLEKLVAVGIKIDDHYGMPQDIEWAFDGILYVLQSRPITTL